MIWTWFSFYFNSSALYVLSCAAWLSCTLFLGKGGNFRLKIRLKKGVPQAQNLVWFPHPLANISSLEKKALTSPMPVHLISVLFLYPLFLSQRANLIWERNRTDKEVNKWTRRKFSLSLQIQRLKLLSHDLEWWTNKFTTLIN